MHGKFAFAVFIFYNILIVNFYIFQLFSNEKLALRMVDQLKLLHVMVISLKYMMSKILIQNTLHGTYESFLR